VVGDEVSLLSVRENARNEVGQRVAPGQDLGWIEGELANSPHGRRPPRRALPLYCNGSKSDTTRRASTLDTPL
jgi:hypothetical protein